MPGGRRILHACAGPRRRYPCDDVSASRRRAPAAGWRTRAFANLTVACPPASYNTGALTFIERAPNAKAAAASRRHSRVRAWEKILSPAAAADAEAGVVTVSCLISSMPERKMRLELTRRRSRTASSLRPNDIPRVGPFIPPPLAVVAKASITRRDCGRHAFAIGPFDEA
jgi:hypothetical protein